MATILDVARLAGVSQGTVSNVLNGKGKCKAVKKFVLLKKLLSS